MNYSEISTVLTNNQNINLLCIGDIMLDKFIYGSVDRISPEAPVPVFAYKNEKMMLGGAGNVALNLSSLNCNTTFLGVVGNDSNANLLSKLMQENDIKHYFVRVKSLPTIVKTRIIASNQHLLRIDNEKKFKIPSSVIPRISTILNKLISKQDIVLLSDYNKGIFSVESCQMIIDLCNKLGKKVIIDPKGNDYSKYSNAFLVKPNLKEFKEATGIFSIDPTSNTFIEDLKLGADILYSRFNIKNLIVTLSEYGMVYISKENGQILHVPTIAKEVFDVSGAGDTSLATIGVCLAKGLSVEQAMMTANIASGIVVGKMGTATVTIEEILKSI